MPAREAIEDLVRATMADLGGHQDRIRGKLGLYSAFSTVAVFTGIAVPVFAGSAVAAALANGALAPVWTKYAAVLTLIAALLTAIHKGFHCETYHEKCRLAITAAGDVIRLCERKLVTPEALTLKDLELIDGQTSLFFRKHADVLSPRWPWATGRRLPPKAVAREAARS